jgi:hypothetical protein
MIENLTQLNASLFQLSSFVDSLEGLQRDCADKKDYRLFPLLSEGYLARIRELNEEIREYLSQQPDVPELAGSR